MFTYRTPSAIELGLGAPRTGHFAPGGADLATRILGVYGSACQLLLLARESDVALVSGKVATWSDRSGNGRDATQGTDANRPTWNATGINGKPSLSLDGGDRLATASFALTSFSAVAVHTVFKDSITANGGVLEFGDASSGNGFLIDVNNGGAGTLSMQFRTNVGISLARSTTSFPMSSAGVVTATADVSLATNEAEIRHNVTNVTNSRPFNNNNTGNFGTAVLSIGSRSGGVTFLTGDISAVVVAGFSDALSGHATQVSDVDTLLKNAWNVS